MLVSMCDIMVHRANTTEEARNLVRLKFVLLRKTRSTRQRFLDECEILETKMFIEYTERFPEKISLLVFEACVGFNFGS